MADNPLSSLRYPTKRANATPAEQPHAVESTSTPTKRPHATVGKQYPGRSKSSAWASCRALAYALFNIASASGIVFANKSVFAVHHFNFTYTLTLTHTLVTVLGMWVFARAGMFQARQLQLKQVAPVAVAFVMYIVFGNLNLKINSVSFYQISKIAVAPAILAIEATLHGRAPSLAVAASVGVVCLGIALATVSEMEGSAGLSGLAVGAAAVGTTALYQVWVGSKQKQLGLGSMQLLHNSAPLSSVLLMLLVFLLEPTGLVPPMSLPGVSHPYPPPEATLIGFPYTPAAVAAIAVSALLGLAVSLSTFLVIGATSSLTYNVVGHIKSVIIICGGVLIFGETLPTKKIYGLLLSMLGIIAYSVIKIREGTLVRNSAVPTSSGRKD